MINYIYKITNNLNGKIYIGVHKTKNVNDNYMGSGKILKSAIEKYGIENFTKEILEYFDSYDDALKKEKQLVNDDFLLREDTYNVRRGGSGGFDYINSVGIPKFKGKKHSEQTKKILSEKSKGNTNTKGNVLTKEHKEKIGKSVSESLSGTTKSDEHKRKISESIKEKHRLKKLRGIGI